MDSRLVRRVSTRHAEPVTLRPTIRPGAPLLRCDATYLRVGTSPGTVIADRPGLRSFLRLLNGARDVDQLRRLARSDVPELAADVEDVLRPLLACAAVVDASPLQVPRPRLRVALHDDAASRPLARSIGLALADLSIGSLDAPDLSRPTHHSCRVKTGSGSSNQEAHGRSTCDCQRKGESGDYAAGFPSSAEAFGPPRIDCRA